MSITKLNFNLSAINNQNISTLHNPGNSLEKERLKKAAAVASRLRVELYNHKLYQNMTYKIFYYFYNENYVRKIHHEILFEELEGVLTLEKLMTDDDYLKSHSFEQDSYRDITKLRLQLNLSELDELKEYYFRKYIEFLLDFTLFETLEKAVNSEPSNFRREDKVNLFKGINNLMYRISPDLYKRYGNKILQAKIEHSNNIF